MGEDARIWGKGTNNLEAYLNVLQARELLQNFKAENLVLARQLLEEAIALDPNYASAYRWLGGTYGSEIFHGLSKDPGESFKQAIKFGQKALAIDENLSEIHSFLGIGYLMQRQHEKAIAAGERAVKLSPNSADAIYLLGRFLLNAGRVEESIPYFKKSIRLNPFAPSTYYMNFGFAYWLMKQYEEAIAACKKGLKRNPDDLWAHMAMAATYAELGHDEEAYKSAKEVLRISPKISLKWVEKTVSWKKRSDVDRLEKALRKAGLK